MKKYLMGWNFMRIFRFAVGIFIIVQGYMMSEWLLMGVGAFFTLLPVFNVGCGSGTCNPASRRTSKTLEQIEFKEVK
ncbi:MAG TPA: hypothetical protein VK102_10225 [Sphingobacterium sp.]|nr:hypothetical protein [Sphingobacterium sp.]